MDMSTIYILSIAFALVGTILSCIYLVPKARRNQLKHPFWIFLHNLFNFKDLLLEKLLKFFYVLSTFFSVMVGFFMLFWVEYDEWLGYYGLLVLLIMPILIRLMYEGLMMFILLVQNTIDINKKLSEQKNDTAPAAPATPAAPSRTKNPVAETPAKPTTPRLNFCTFCGSPIDENNKCTRCGRQY